MAGSRDKVHLSDLCEAIVDCEHKTALTQPWGIPSIRTTNINNGRLDIENANRVSEETYKKWTVRLEPQPGDLILAREAPVGEVGIVPLGQRVCLGQRTVLIRTTKQKLVSRYLLYLLLTPKMQHEMVSRAEGSTVPHINMSDIRNLEILHLPPLSEQKAIAHILSTLDDKIELNQQMNRNLEALAQAIFKSWFVDFDPVKAKMEGRQPAGMDIETAALFPDSFEDSQVGEIPKGWRVGALQEIAEIVMGQSPPGETYNELGEGMPFYQGARDFGFRFPTRRVYCTAPTRFAEKDDTLFSVRAPVGNLNIAMEPCAIGRGVAALRLKIKPGGFLYYLLNANQSQWEKFEAEGTVFGSVSKSDVQDFQIIVPCSELLRQFGGLVKPLDAQIESNECENRTLAAIRDALLPKLMSGEIRVKEAEKLVAAAA